MSVGPLRRLVGALGLLGLVPLLAMLALDLLSPEDAAFRAIVMLVGLLLLGRLVNWGVSVLASEVEGAEDPSTSAHDPAEDPVRG